MIAGKHNQTNKPNTKAPNSLHTDSAKFSYLACQHKEGGALLLKGIKTMALTREQADKIEIDENVIVGFSGSGGDICAEQLAKWAYRRLETWPDLLEASKDFVSGWLHFCDCIDFGKSTLDAEAIRFMNEVPGKIQTAINKTIKAT